ncbi:MAG: DNA polymerase III subunit beta [Actinomycetota bacterium]
MKVFLSQADFNTAMQITQKAVSQKSLLPILSGILLNINEESIDLYSTDLEMSIKHNIACRIENRKDSSSFVIPARLTADIVKSLPDSKVSLNVDEKNSNVKITCGQCEFEVKTMPAEDYPGFPTLQKDIVIVVDGKKLSEAVKQVIKAASKDETRPILCGILLVIEKGRLRLVATDSYRLSIRETAIGGKDVELKAIVPARCMDEVSRVCNNEEVEVGLAKNQICFKTKSTTIVSRLIEGNFPNYQQLLPDGCEVKVKLNREGFINSLKRVSILAQNNTLVKIKIMSSSIQLMAASVDIGSAVEELEAQVDGEGMEIAFNPQFLVDGLNSISEEEVFIELNSPLRPGIIRPVKTQDFIYLIMPIRLG